MPNDPGSFLGVDPKPSGSPPEPPPSPESIETRRARLSMKAFGLGLTISVVWRRCAVQSHRYVLFWVIPASLGVVLFMAGLVFFTVSDAFGFSFLVGEQSVGAGFFAAVVVLMIASMVFVALRWEARRDRLGSR